MAEFLFNLSNHNNHVVQNKTKFKLGCPRSTLAENWNYILYKYKFSHFNFYTDKGNILCKILLKTVDGSITHMVRELCELRDHVNTCKS